MLEIVVIGKWCDYLVKSNMASSIAAFSAWLYKNLYCHKEELFFVKLLTVLFWLLLSFSLFHFVIANKWQTTVKFYMLSSLVNSLINSFNRWARVISCYVVYLSGFCCLHKTYHTSVVLCIHWQFFSHNLLIFWVVWMTLSPTLYS